MGSSDGGYTSQQYQALLRQEVFVDVPRLREMALSGIPNDVRGDVWMYLLNVRRPMKTQDVSAETTKVQEYQSFSTGADLDTVGDVTIRKRIRGEIKRYARAILDMSETDRLRLIEVMEEVVSVFGERSLETPLTPEMVHLLGPCALVLNGQRDIYFLFTALVESLKDRFRNDTMNLKTAEFIALFGSIHPDLHSHFETEEVEPNDWATSWLRTLLAQELPIECTLRVWDTYFAMSEPNYELHPYVCLAILGRCKESLLELDGSEIMSYLRKLPMMSMDELITQAQVIRQDAFAKNLV